MTSVCMGTLTLRIRPEDLVIAGQCGCPPSELEPAVRGYPQIPEAQQGAMECSGRKSSHVVGGQTWNKEVWGWQSKLKPEKEK